MRPLPSSGMAPLRSEKGGAAKLRTEQKEDLNAGEDGAGVGVELDVGLVGKAENESVGAEQPGPEEQRAFLTAPQRGEFVGSGKGAVGVLEDVGDGEVVGEDGADEREGGGGDGEKAGDAGAARSVGQALGRDARGLTGGDQAQCKGSREKIVGGESQRDKKGKTTEGCHEDSNLILALVVGLRGDRSG